MKQAELVTSNVGRTVSVETVEMAEMVPARPAKGRAPATALVPAALRAL